MSEAEPQRPTRDRTWQFIDELRLALSFLTILPVGPGRAVAPDLVAESFSYFPIAGFIIGGALAAEDWLLGFAFGHATRSVLIVLSLAIETGAIHLDAVADTGDALGAWRDRERALAILRESAIGSFGALALFFVLSLKILPLAAMAGSRRYGALYLAPGLGRWAMVAVSYRLDYLRTSGAGSLLLSSRGGRNFAFATATAIVAAALAGSRRTLGACAAAAIAAWLIRSFYRRWLGGVTGDLIGAAGEVTEVVVLLAMSA